MVIPIAEKLNNDDLLAYAYQNLARSYLALGKNDSALVFINQAVELFIPISRPFI